MSNKRLMTQFFGFFLLLVSATLFAANEDDPENRKSPGYISLGQPLILNLASNDKRMAYLQIKADVLLSDDDDKALVEAHVPAIRHKLIVLLSEQDVNDMKTPIVREMVRQQATNDIRQMLDKLVGSTHFESILFSSFLVQ